MSIVAVGQAGKMDPAHRGHAAQPGIHADLTAALQNEIIARTEQTSYA
jgi:hypothetical protein